LFPTKRWKALKVTSARRSRNVNLKQHYVEQTGRKKRLCWARWLRNSFPYHNCFRARHYGRSYCSQTGGRGHLSVTALVFALVVGAILVFQTGTGLNFCARPHLWVCWGLYLTLSLFLPAFGIAFNDFPTRTIAAIQEGFVALGFLFAGSWLRSRSTGPSLLKRYFLLAVSFQAILAIVQMAAIIPGISSSWPVSIIHNWDISSKTNLNSEAIVAARATGAYLNPNALGFSAMISFWASALFLKGFAQKYALAASLLTLVLSALAE